jgi:RNA polymerase sigma-70 factor (ECF subfamily)
LRWHEAEVKDIESPIAFLITVTTRLCLDRLRAQKKEREQYTGSWLPESIVVDYVPSPETQLEIAGDVRVALLAALERLGPEEWPAFLLHEVLDYEYSEVARMIGKSEAACRQLIHRSYAHLRDSRARFAVTPERHERGLKKFLAAIGTGDRQAILALLLVQKSLSVRSDFGQSPIALKRTRCHKTAKSRVLCNVWGMKSF